ncbi:hypothetical protein D1BOALGB6SA_6585, partial [Olavius sp. associated proteobacterium Delta 1]
TGGGGGRVAVYYGDISGFDTANIVAYGGTGRRGRGGAGTVFLKDSSQAYGELIIDNNGGSGETPLRSVGSGVITDLSATVLTDENADFPLPDPDTGALGLEGLELNPNIEQERTFTIIDNTATTITINAADGDLTEVAQVGNRYIGVYTFDTLTVSGESKVTAQDIVEIAEGGSLTVNGASLEVALLDDSVASVVDTANGTVIETLDTTLPEVEILLPPEVTTVGTSQTLMVPVRVTDDVALGTIVFSRSGVVEGSQSREVPGEVQTYTTEFELFVPGDLPPQGLVILEISVTDAARNRSVPVQRTLSVTDGSGPIVNITSPLPGTFFRPGDDVEVVVEASDFSSVTSIGFSASGVASASDERSFDPAVEAATATFSFQIPADAPAAGSLFLSASATDAAGNTESAPVVSVGILDITNPTVSLTYPHEGAVVGQVLTVDVSTSDDVGVSSVEFYLDGSLQETVSAPPFSWEWDTTLYSEGPHVVGVVAYDETGNSAVDEVTVTVNQTVLTVSSDTVWESGTYTYGDVHVTNGASLTFNGNVTLRANSLTLTNGSVLTHSAATTATTSRLNLEVEALSIDGTSAIDVSGKGYLGGGRSATGDYGRTLGNVPGSYRGVSGSYGGLGKIGDPSYPAPDT